MIRRLSPALDLRIVPASGITRSGQPLSYNRAPAPDLVGWIARLSVTKLHLPEGYTLECGMFADTASLRIQLSGCCTGHTASGMQRFGRGAVFLGPHSRVMPVKVAGDFITVGLSLRPSACSAFRIADMAGRLDSIAPATFRSPEQLLALIDPDGSPEDWLAALEDCVRDHIAELNGAQPDPLTARFEEIAFLDPIMPIEQAAREIDVDRRRLERLVVRDFGMSPKQVLKRARALDMASLLRGVADAEEGEAFMLRYYDESHLIREFVELFGMPPRQFVTQPQPLLTLTLEARQARRLEMLKRVAEGGKRPWE